MVPVPVIQVVGLTILVNLPYEVHLLLMKISSQPLSSITLSGFSFKLEFLTLFKCFVVRVATVVLHKKT